MGCNQENEELYKKFQEKNNCRETADILLPSLDKAKKEKWIKIVKRSSKKAWNLLRKIDPNIKRNRVIANISRYVSESYD